VGDLAISLVRVLVQEMVRKRRGTEVPRLGPNAGRSETYVQSSLPLLAEVTVPEPVRPDATALPLPAVSEVRAALVPVLSARCSWVAVFLDSNERLRVLLSPLQAGLVIVPMTVPFTVELEKPAQMIVT
jgi:hypothetical protein